MNVYDGFMVDAIDLHCHIDLEFSQDAWRKREPEWEWLPKAEALGMRGIVLKSHWWPTAVAVPYIKQMYQGPVTLWSSLVLNPIAGGTELWAVESAARFGARMVWLPTWSSCHDLEHGGFSSRLPNTFEHFRIEEIQGFSFLDEHEKLTEHGHELLRYCHSHDLTLGTGHVSWQESLAFAEEAHRIGFERLVFTHPALSAPLDAVQRAAELGAFPELVWNNIGLGRITPQAGVQWLRDVGIDQAVVSTDYFRGSHPPPPELFRHLLGLLYESGLTPDEVKTVAVRNPARALGL